MNRKLLLEWCMGLVLCACCLHIYAQKSIPTKTVATSKEAIRIHHADRLLHDLMRYGDGQILQGHVSLSHAGMHLTCDSAVFYNASNSFMAYGKVRFTQGDTLALLGDSLYYDGTSQFAQVFRNVQMHHRKMRLYTDHLNYDRLANRGFYDVGGKIVDQGTTLTSQRGDYFTDKREAEFTDDVLLLNTKKDTLRTDSLHYNLKTKWAHATGRTNLYSGGSHIYTIDGWYNSATGKAHMKKRPHLFNKGRKLVGDSIAYDKQKGFSQAFKNVVFTDTTDVDNKNMLLGDYGYYKQLLGESMVTGKALVKNFSRQSDTLYMHADTLRMYSFDLNTDSAYRKVHAYPHGRAYRKDVQAVSDSLVFHSGLKKLSLYKDPIAWSEDRQILGEEINIFVNDSTIDSVYVERQALIVQALRDSTLFNQVTGNMILAYFQKGELYRAFVDGNAMMINYPMERDSTFLYHNYCEAAKLRLDVENRKIRRLWAGAKPSGKTYPLGLAPKEHSRFANFAWFDYIRPIDAKDVFEWRGKVQEQKLKIRPRREVPLQNLKKEKNRTTASQYPANTQ